MVSPGVSIIRCGDMTGPRGGDGLSGIGWTERFDGTPHRSQTMSVGIKRPH